MLQRCTHACLDEHHGPLRTHPDPAPPAEGGPLSGAAAALQDELECSRATLYRDVAFLRDALGAPIESGDGDEAAFRYEAGEGERFELPGLWLTSRGAAPRCSR